MTDVSFTPEELHEIGSSDIARPSTHRKKHLYIVGFAPSWEETPWDDPGADYWGLNNLHKLAPDKPWTAWFQLHDVMAHHGTDVEHLDFLATANIPVWMFPEHLEKFPIPMGRPYPRQAVLSRFGDYFTNSISWMIAFAIMSDAYDRISVYGIDMAQDSEYGSQRPSCEYFLGLAAGQGIEVYIPPTSDLLKTPFLYGIEDEMADVMRTKYQARIADLTKRKQQMEQEINQRQMVLHQLLGALEDCNFWLTRWTPIKSRSNA